MDPPPTFVVKSLKAKGTTLFNACAQNSSTVVTIQAQWAEIVIYDLNIFNFYGINVSSILSTSGGGSNSHKFYNCNFAGVIVQRGAFLNPAQQTTTFYNCSFNIHLRNFVNADHEFCANVAVFVDCLVRYTGSCRNWYTTQGYNGLYDNRCKFIGNLKLDSTFYFKLMFNSSYSGYNVVDMNVDCSMAHMNADLTVINQSKVTATISSTAGYVMQSDDPTKSDYIYNADNLEAVGFLVGKVID